MQLNNSNIVMCMTVNVHTNVYRRPEEGAVHLPDETREGIPEEVIYVLDLKGLVESVRVKLLGEPSRGVNRVWEDLQM